MRRFRPPFLAYDVGSAPGGKLVWVSSRDRDEVAIPRSAKRQAAKASCRRRAAAALQLPTALVYVASGESGILRVRRVNGARLRRTVVPRESYNVQQAQGCVVTPGLGTGTLCVLDRHGGVRFRKTVTRSSHDACIVTIS